MTPAPPEKRRTPGPTQLADGRWQWKVTMRNGKRKSVYGHTERECRKAADEARAQVAAGHPLPDKRETLCQFLTGYREWPAFDAGGEPLPPKGWLGTVVKPTLRPNVYHRYEINCRCHIIPALGDRQISRITPQELQLFLAELQDGDERKRRGLAPLAPQTVKQIHAVLRNAMNVALMWELVSRNPCLFVKTPRIQRRQYRVLSPDDALVLLQRVQGHPLECIITLAFTTGMREGELLGLRWADVDPVNGLLMVRQQAQRVPHEGWHYPAPKSDTSNRIVLLTPHGIAALARQRERVDLMQRAAAGEWQDHDLVHPNRFGRPIEKGNLLRRWKTFLLKNGFEEMTVHELRHSTATVLFGLGVPLRLVQEILGHASLSITADIYTGYVPPLHKEAMEKLSSLLTRRGLTPSGALVDGQQSSNSPQRCRALPAPPAQDTI